MTDAEIIEVWSERAAIIEEGCSSDPFWKHQPADWRRHEAERLAYWDVRRAYNVERMPRECFRTRQKAG